MYGCIGKTTYGHIADITTGHIEHFTVVASQKGREKLSHLKF